MTEKQQEIFDFIIWYIRENLYPPTVREIGDGVGLKSTSSVFSHLKTMKRKGYIDMPKGSSPRAIRIPGYRFVKEAT